VRNRDRDRDRDRDRTVTHSLKTAKFAKPAKKTRRELYGLLSQFHHQRPYHLAHHAACDPAYPVKMGYFHNFVILTSNSHSLHRAYHAALRSCS